MAVLVTQPDRDSFLRCRRQWDLSARMRRNLEPSAPPPGPPLQRGIRAALAVYYFPGMWDWDRAVTLPLVVAGFERALIPGREPGAGRPSSGAGPRSPEAGTELLRRYFDWAPAADRFAPVLIDPDFEVQVYDPAQPGLGLTGPGGEPARFRGRIDMLAIDEHDAYWIVRHELISGRWPPAAGLAADEASLAACWAWQQFYPGLTIAGTIRNELHLGSADPPPRLEAARPAESGPDAVPARRGRGRWAWRRQGGELAGPEPVVVRQHEPSGGGRSIPQHRRMYAVAREPQQPWPVRQDTGPGFRRTWVRHTQPDIAAAGRRLGAEVTAMLAAAGPARPDPSDAHCRPCAFSEPCLAMRAGRDSEFLLRSAFRTRPADETEEGRLGGGSWGFGRGAAAFRRG
jgi:hypothetical protein